MKEAEKAAAAGQNERIRQLRQARGLEKADLVLKNGRIVNVFTHELLDGDIAISDGRIVGVGSYEGKKNIDLKKKTVVPGLIDAHIHIESTMAAPLTAAWPMLSRGTTTIVADPHEIVNAAGTAGLDFMIEQAKASPIDIRIMVPSSVPSTEFETNGAGRLRFEQMKPYVESGQVFGLGEVMRFGDVLEGEEQMNAILSGFEDMPRDGHAPGLNEKELQAYRLAGIDNDHEAITAQDAIDRLRAGFHLLIREGSGARNLEALLGGLIERHIPLDHCSFCTDDRHLEDILEEGHIDRCIRQAMDLGADPFDAISMATINTARHYGMKDKGAIAPGYAADLVIVDNLKHFHIEDVYKDGVSLSELEKTAKPAKIEASDALRSSIQRKPVSAEQLVIPEGLQHMIEIVPGQLITRHLIADPAKREDKDSFNLLVNCERYGKTGEIQTALVCGFSLHGGAIASSYAHDAHNILALGDSREDLALAINTLIEQQGGYVLVRNGQVAATIPLRIAGVMSEEDARTLLAQQTCMSKQLRQMGLPEDIDPFVNLSFLALPVIGEIRLTDRGLFDTEKQCFLHNPIIDSDEE